MAMPVSRAPTNRCLRSAAVGVLVLLAGAGCAGVAEPRWANSDRDVAIPAVGESPRVTRTVGEPDDLGVVELSAIVHSEATSITSAPTSGIVSDVAVEVPGEVDKGSPVLTFTPDPTTAQQLEIEIAELERALAAERGDDDALAAADETLRALSEQQVARAEIITAPLAGWISGARSDLEYRVQEGAPLFTVSDSDSLVARIVLSGSEVPAEMGAEVVVRAGNNEKWIGEVQAIESDTEQDRTTIDVGFAGQVALGDPLDVEIAVRRSDDRVWLPVDALRRAGGSSFVLIERADGSLDRADLELGRRTSSFVELLEQTSGDPIGPGTVLVLP